MNLTFGDDMEFTMTTLPYEELKALVVLSRLGGGSRRLPALLQEGMKPAEILTRIESENFLGKAGNLEKIERGFDPELEMDLCEKKGIRLLTLFDAEYPFLLKQTPDPPALLYMAGYFEESDEAAVAVVGSRYPSLYGKTQTKQFAGELARFGLTIVSGFAKGIDQEAHEAALEVRYGRTVAVLGCGADVVYPPASRGLYERIAERGAVITEYALGTEPLAENFPRRNRIIAGLALGVLVVEAHARSGSLITAHEAVDYGREVFAVPGPVDQLTSQGTHRLLKEGAFLAETPLDVFEVLAPSLWPFAGRSPGSGEKGSSASLDMNEGEQSLIRVLGKGPLAFDALAGQCPLGPGELASFLTALELKKKIRRAPDGRFALI